MSLFLSSLLFTVFPKVSNNHKKILPASSRGFTLIELLIVVAITVIISSLGLFLNLDFYKTYALSSERDIVVGILMKARNKAANNFNQSAHGVFVDTNGYTIFKGSSYALRNASYDELIKRNNSVTASGIQEVVFEQLTGGLTTLEGDIVLDNNVKSVNISLNNEGRINW